MTIVIIGNHNSPAACAHAMKAGQALYATAEEYSRQVIVMKQERPLPAAGANDDFLGSNLQQAILLKGAKQIFFIETKDIGLGSNLNSLMACNCRQLRIRLI